MNQPLIDLPMPGEPDTFRIRSIGLEDQENLRRWRNRHRKRFFQSSPISKVAQARWFAGYQSRPDDYLFLLLINEKPTGCVGIRLRDEEWDVYNVLRGSSRSASSGAMSKALQAVLNFAVGKKSAPITLSVMADNPAVRWYERQGFRIFEDRGNFLKMRLEIKSQKKNPDRS